MGTESIDYCREIETYLCRKNDGHLIRVVGPSFELVSKWAADGVPLKIAFRGIDRSFERYYRKGPRRRPLKVDYCEADVRESFEEWRRAVGVTLDEAAADRGRPGAIAPRQSSLPDHLQRALQRLTAAHMKGRLGVEGAPFLDRVSLELDAARASARGLRGDARRALIDRLAALDRGLLMLGRRAIGDAERETLEGEADDELAGFRTTMPAEAYGRAREAAVDRLIRERLDLPVLALS